MKKVAYSIILIAGSFLAIAFISACGKPKEAKIEVSEHEFFIQKLSDHAYSVHARGKIRNIGEVDVKKVVVTAYCRSCSNGLVPGTWTIAERDRAPAEMDMISYLVAGAEEEFCFEDVAVMYNTVPEKPKIMPEDMEIVIESFEIVG